MWDLNLGGGDERNAHRSAVVRSGHASQKAEQKEPRSRAQNPVDRHEKARFPGFQLEENNGSDKPDAQRHDPTNAKDQSGESCQEHQ